MPRILFWNVQRKSLDGWVLPLVVAHQPDLVVLIEPLPTSLLATSPLSVALSTSGYLRADTERFGVFARNVSLDRPLVGFRSDRAEPWFLTPPNQEEWLVVLAHGPDRRNAQQDDTRAYFFRLLANRVRELERERGHRRTVILGDFNANPFEASVLGANGVHAIGVTQVRGEIDRRVRNAARADFFYNPMWQLYGSVPGGAAGAATYYYRDGDEATEPFWHLFDQVLIRPEFANRLPVEHLRILTHAGVLPLTDGTGLPDHRNASDHLPVVFTIV